MRISHSPPRIPFLGGGLSRKALVSVVGDQPLGHEPRAFQRCRLRSGQLAGDAGALLPESDELARKCDPELRFLSRLDALVDKGLADSLQARDRGSRRSPGTVA